MAEIRSAGKRALETESPTSSEKSKVARSDHLSEPPPEQSRKSNGSAGAQRDDADYFMQDAVMFSPPPPFRGLPDEDFSQWLKRFNRWALCCHYSTMRKCEILPVLLHERAEAIYDTLQPSVREDYDKLTTVLTERLQPPRLSDLKSVELHAREQRPDEAVADFAYDIQMLTRQAYPELKAEAQEQLTRRLFLNKLTSSLRRIVMLREPLTFDEAVAAARRQEAQEQFTCARFNLTEKQNSELIDKLLDRVSKLERTVDERTGDEIDYDVEPEDDGPDEEWYQRPNGYGNPPRVPRRALKQSRRLRWTDRGQPICWQCNRPGHKQAECPDVMHSDGPKMTDESHVVATYHVRRSEDEDHKMLELEAQHLKNEREVQQLQNERLMERMYPRRVATIRCVPSTAHKGDADARTNELEQKLKRVEEDNTKLQRVAIEAESKCRNLKQQLEKEVRKNQLLHADLMKEEYRSKGLEDQLTRAEAALQANREINATKDHINQAASITTENDYMFDYLFEPETKAAEDAPSESGSTELILEDDEDSLSESAKSSTAERSPSVRKRKRKKKINTIPDYDEEQEPIYDDLQGITQCDRDDTDLEVHDAFETERRPATSPLPSDVTLISDYELATDDELVTDNEFEEDSGVMDDVNEEEKSTHFSWREYWIEQLRLPESPKEPKEVNSYNNETQKIASVSSNNTQCRERNGLKELIKDLKQMQSFCAETQRILDEPLKTAKQFIDSASSNNAKCRECEAKDAALKKLRSRQTVLMRQNCKTIQLEQQFAGMAGEINAIKAERDDALQKVMNLEIRLIDADAQITVLRSNQKLQNYDGLVEENRDLRSRWSQMDLACERLHRNLESETKYRQAKETKDDNEVLCSSCTMKNALYTQFRNEIRKR